MLGVAPVISFNYVFAYQWLKDNCWSRHNPDGECINTSVFIELLFGWTAMVGEHHAWNLSPNNLVLDLTVEQFGRHHAMELVPCETIYDELYQKTYRYIDKQVHPIHASISYHISWIKKLAYQIEANSIHDEFGIPQEELLSRIQHQLKRHHCRWLA